jgi:PKD repeat protein
MRQTILTFVLLLLLSLSSNAQLVADFTMNKEGGCSPLLVQFTNTTRGASANATYRWEFSNGNTSSLTNPGAIFQEEKQYTLTLTVKDGNATATKTSSVTVYKKPEVKFSASTQKGCVPFDVLFSADASPGDGNLLWYDWDFGDGSTQKASVYNVQHTYKFVQNAGVSLTVTNSYGCYTTLQKTDMISAIPLLLADFETDQQVICRETDSVRFTNKSTGPGTLSYVWDFGDGKTSTQKNPSYAFNKKGNYDVKLTATSSEGCTAVNQKTNYLNVANFKTDFDVPAPLCKGSSSYFNNTSSPLPTQSNWQVNGQAVYTYMPSMFYSFYTAGEHTIRLTNSYGNCIDTVTKLVKIKEPPVLNGFVAELGGQCGSPVQVKFRDTTAGAVKWRWYLDNYTHVQSTAQAPVYNYTFDYSYWVSLEVANADGCTANVSQPLSIQKPYVRIFSPQQGPSGEGQSCGPGTFDFKAVTSESLTTYLGILLTVPPQPTRCRCTPLPNPEITWCRLIIPLSMAVKARWRWIIM